MIFNSAVPRTRLTHAVEVGPPHLRPVWVAIRDAGIGFMMVAQHAGAFEAPNTRPTLLLIGDDMKEALGPAAFHRQSLRRFVSQCSAAVIVGCEPLPIAYASAAATVSSPRANW